MDFLYSFLFIYMQVSCLKVHSCISRFSSLLFSLLMQDLVFIAVGSRSRQTIFPTPFYSLLILWIGLGSCLPPLTDCVVFSVHFFLGWFIGKMPEFISFVLWRVKARCSSVMGLECVCWAFSVLEWNVSHSSNKIYQLMRVIFGPCGSLESPSKIIQVWVWGLHYFPSKIID